jgi:hypothetical protein
MVMSSSKAHEKMHELTATNRQPGDNYVCCEFRLISRDQWLKHCERHHSGVETGERVQTVKLLDGTFGLPARCVSSGTLQYPDQFLLKLDPPPAPSF